MIFELKSEAHRKTALEALRAAKIGWVVRIEPANRTSAQNAFYWALLQSISEQVMPGGKSHSRDTWHIYFKTLFLPGRMIELPNGELIEQENSDFDSWVVTSCEPPPYAVEKQPLYTAPPQRQWQGLQNESQAK